MSSANPAVRRAMVLMTLTASLMGSARAAFADDPSPPPPVAPAVITPPRLKPHEPPAYPSGDARAHGDADVTLILVVGPDGRVSSASIESGNEPFAGAALSVANAFLYEPALRNGKPVAAKVRVLITFREPAPPARTLPADASGASAAASGAGQRTRTQIGAAEVEDVIEEVRVAGQRKEPGMTASFRRSEVRELPGSFGDPFRALEVMPGVTPIVTGLPFFYVRGAPPGNVGYYLDGVRVPYLYHVGLGPSVVHPGIVDRVDLYAGGYPARYGRFAGGIVAAESEPPRKDAHAEWNVRLVDAGVLAETGFAGDRGSILVGGRYSYTAALISLAAPNAVLDYRDFQIRATYDLGARDTITLFSFGAYDLIGTKNHGALDVAFGSEFYRADLRWDRKLTGGGRLRTAVTVGIDRTLLGQDRVARMRTVGTRVEWSKPASERLLVRAGADVNLERYDTQLLGEGGNDEFQANAFPSRTDLQAGVRADVVYKPTRAFEVVPGLRVDLFSSGGVAALGIDPRIATRLALSKRVRLLQAHGIANQPPSFVAPIPGLTIGSLSGGLQRSLQTSAGVEVDLPAEFTGSANVFRHAALRLTDFLTSAARFDTNDDRAFDRRATGDAYGLEIFVRRPLTKRIGALASYTLSRATQRERGVVQTGAFDRTHVFNIASAVDLGKNWRFGAKFVTYSGNPQLFDTQSVLGGKTPGRRTDAFYRVDFRLAKKWMLGKRAFITIVLEVVNATLSKDKINDQEIGPITIPSLGVEGEL